MGLMTVVSSVVWRSALLKKHPGICIVQAHNCSGSWKLVSTVYKKSHSADWLLENCSVSQLLACKTLLNSSMEEVFQGVLAIAGCCISHILFLLWVPY